MPAFDEVVQDRHIFYVLMPAELFNRGGIFHIAIEPLPA
jgi:hypothetical protein